MQTLITTLGGLGLFLLGMVIMTDSLRTLAGGHLRGYLLRFTHSPLSGAITGAASTALLQSSSATTVTAVGLVASGMLRFREALGIIFGANIGTTITGWLVVLLGFKLQLGELALPIILCGTLLRLFGRHQFSMLGIFLAGFGLIFLGITYLQAGMSGLDHKIQLFTAMDEGWFSLLKLAGLGILFTIITQSSSAGVAATLTALYAGAIPFSHAAALIIGMDVGTTVTAALAAIGGSINSRRTGLSHVIYNLLTGIMALLLIWPFIWMWQGLFSENTILYPEIALVAFHSLFNTLGVILVLPFTQAFARLIIRLLPDQQSSFLQGLDTGLLSEPDIAITSAHRVIQQQFLRQLSTAQQLLTHVHNETGHRRMTDELTEIQLYLDKIHLEKHEGPQWQQLYALVHTLDHLQRLERRLQEQERIRGLSHRDELSHLAKQMQPLFSRLIELFQREEIQSADEHAQRLARNIRHAADQTRDDILALVASDKINVPVATGYLESLRWLERTTTHIARISHYLAATTD
ncbi:MAG: Na/Pi cotransporter family protein [Gammaproteobacteria bacterium]|nr:Na/Pi cotransporter family protein [Gammaproteobacteria bacterium]